MVWLIKLDFQWSEEYIEFTIMSVLDSEWSDFYNDVCFLNFFVVSVYTVL